MLLSRAISCGRTMAVTSGYALRMCRPSLGAAIPGNAVLTEENGLRVITVTIDREGNMHGHSAVPEMQISLDAMPRDRLAAVTAILFP